MDRNRTPTGAEGLDHLIGGGFPSKSLIVIAGNPGTGKTVFSAQFLHRGAAEYGENGMYVSFAESREAFLENMLGFGFDFEKLEKDNNFFFLDMVTVKEEGIPSVLEKAIDEIRRLKAKRLVIDSFSAMAQALSEPIEARVIIHLVLSKMVRQMGCTTILISEIPTGEDRIGLGMEEFVADGLIRLKANELDGRLLRDLEIVKLRGTELPERKLVFTLEGGFNVFPPFRAKPVEKTEGFRPIHDPPGKFSTGSEELDRLLDGGYAKGSGVLLEVGEQVSTLQYQLILTPTACNFGAQGRAIMVIPSSGVDHNYIKKLGLQAGAAEGDLNRLLRVCSFGPTEAPGKHGVSILDGKSIEEDYQNYIKIGKELVKETRQPVLHIIGADSTIAYYGKEPVTKISNLEATRTREEGNLSILVLKPGYADLSKILGAIADMHLKITREHGALIFYGIKPRTGLYVLEADSSRGHAMPKLTPIV